MTKVLNFGTTAQSEAPSDAITSRYPYALSFGVLSRMAIGEALESEQL
jgi:hypothetical protein